MRRVLRVVGIVAVAVVTVAIGFSALLYFYTADLPPISQLTEFNPVSESEARLRSCDGTERTVTALPREKLGKYMVAALIAAEGKPDTRSPFVALFFPDGQHVTRYQFQLAQSLACTNRSPINRQLQELRLANAINRKFDQQELLTTYLNRVYLGPEIYGIEAGAKKYFGKPALQLTLDETAVIAGIIRSPRLYPLCPTLTGQHNGATQYWTRWLFSVAFYLMMQIGLRLLRFRFWNSWRNIAVTPRRLHQKPIACLHLRSSRQPFSHFSNESRTAKVRGQRLAFL